MEPKPELINRLVTASFALVPELDVAAILFVGSRALNLSVGSRSDFDIEIIVEQPTSPFRIKQSFDVSEIDAHVGSLQSISIAMAAQARRGVPYKAFKLENAVTLYCKSEARAQLDDIRNEALHLVSAHRQTADDTRRAILRWEIQELADDCLDLIEAGEAEVSQIVYARTLSRVISALLEIDGVREVSPKQLMFKWPYLCHGLNINISDILDERSATRANVIRLLELCDLAIRGPIRDGERIDWSMSNKLPY